MESMFDIYTTQDDGTMLLVESVECLTKACQTAQRLSVLFPGESFAYVERTQAFCDLASIADEVGAFAFHCSANLPLPC